MASLKVLRIAAAVATSGGLLASTGIAAHASPWAWQHHQAPKTVVTNTQVTSTDNKTSLDVANNNPQNAVTGDATIVNTPNKHHDGGNMGGSATAGSGGASNISNASITLGVSSDGGNGSTTTSSSSSDMPGTTGNTTVTDKQVTKTNNVTKLNVVNNNEQNAVTGDATIVGNGGTAKTGDASNNSTSTFIFTVSSSGAQQ